METMVGAARILERVGFVRRMMILTIEQGWVPGWGPGGVRYADSDEAHLAIIN
jgi:hypothetical protein